MNELRDKVIDTWKRQAQCGKDAGLSVDDTIINCADAVISAVMESTGWQDIAKYKGGKALFYCPPITEQRHASNNRPEYYSLDIPSYRSPTRWMPLLPPSLETKDD
jgi:hypothetical protein